MIILILLGAILILLAIGFATIAFGGLYIAIRYVLPIVLIGILIWLLIHLIRWIF